MQNQENPQRALDRLDEPLPHELTAEEKKQREMRRIADENRAAMAAIASREQGTRTR